MITKWLSNLIIALAVLLLIIPLAAGILLFAGKVENAWLYGLVAVVISAAIILVLYLAFPYYPHAYTDKQIDRKVHHIKEDVDDIDKDTSKLKHSHHKEHEHHKKQVHHMKH